MSMEMQQVRSGVNLWLNRACSVNYGKMSAIYIHLQQTLICCSTGLQPPSKFGCFYKNNYLPVSPSLAISTFCRTIGDDINKAMTMMTDQAATERFVTKIDRNGNNRVFR